MGLAWSRECRGSPALVPNQHMQPTPLALLPLRLGSELALNAVKGQALVVTILPGGDPNAEAKSSQMWCGGSGGSGNLLSECWENYAYNYFSARIR